MIARGGGWHLPRTLPPSDDLGSGSSRRRRILLPRSGQRSLVTGGQGLQGRGCATTGNWSSYKPLARAWPADDEKRLVSNGHQR